MKLESDEIGISPESVDLLIMDMINDAIKKEIKDDKLLNRLIDQYNSIQVSSTVMLKLFFDYCKDDYNIRSFLSNTCVSELSSYEKAFKNDFYYPILKIRYSYFDKIIFSKLGSIVSEINNDIDNIDTKIEDLTDVQRKLFTLFYDIDDEVEARQFESDYDEYDSQIRRLQGRNIDLKRKMDDIDSLKNYNEEMARFSLSVYEYICTRILNNQVLKEEDFYNLFLMISEKDEYQVESDEFKCQMIERLISFAHTCEVSLSSDCFKEETKIKKIG